MNNKITLKGTILNVSPSHELNGVSFSKANLIVMNSNHKESIIDLSFKTNSNPYKEGDQVILEGNIRSRAIPVAGDHARVNIYVFTYFDVPEEMVEGNNNKFSIEGTIVKNKGVRKFENGNINNQFTLLNSIEKGEKKLDSYLPCLSWNNIAHKTSYLEEGTKVSVEGELRSREYKKYIDGQNFELRVAHELLVTSFKEIADGTDI